MHLPRAQCLDGARGLLKRIDTDLCLLAARSGP
jgi:hypothetical protein